MSLPRYLVIDVFKATAMVIVLALHTFVLSGLTTERNGALLGFEMMSGLFYELAGLGTARSVCRALSGGQLKRRVLGRLLRRGLMLVGASRSDVAQMQVSALQKAGFAVRMSFPSEATRQICSFHSRAGLDRI